MAPWHFEQIYWSDLFLLFMHSSNAICGQQYLSHCSLSLPPSLSPSQAGVPVRSLWLDLVFLRARHFYWTGPCCIASFKRRSRWSAFAVIVNEGNDSEFKNMLMTPLETAVALNVDEAVFPPPPSRSSPWCWLEFQFGDDGKWYCPSQWIQCVTEPML